MEEDRIKKRELTWEEWKHALRVPPPFKNNKKYTRKNKHKSSSI
jgi:hypothetical protein